MNKKAPLLALAASLLAACTTTQEAKPSAMKPPSGFLGNYDQLQPVEKGKAELRYIDAQADWSRYDGIMIEPVTFWGDQASKVSPHDRQMLCDHAYLTLRKHLEKQLKLVDRRGPGVMVLRAALTDAQSATPVLRAVSMVAPSAHVVGTMEDLATGAFPFAGGAQGEAEITDSMSGRRLAAFSDRRVGGGSLKDAAVWRWGDALHAMDDWSELLSARIVTLRSQPSVP